MSDHKKYKKPPLVEAVFELFYKTSDWSPVIPGLFYNEIKANFPNITSNQGGFGITFNPKGVKIGNPGIETTQYKNERGDTIIQLSGNLLTVNKLPRYIDWESFKKTIIDTIEALKNTFKNVEIDRIGLKFINKINIGEVHSYENFKKYFKVYPTIPKNITKDLNSIQISIESPLEKETEILALSLSTIRSEPNLTAPVLFQLYQTRIKDFSGTNIDAWIEEAHNELIESFKNSLTDHCIKEFDNE